MNPVDNPGLYAPLTLAFVGDAVYSLIVRQRVVEQHGSMSGGKLHRQSVRYVSATAQARLYDLMLERGVLSEEETSILKRGRNAGGMTAPKHTDLAHYRKATAVEALFGYLHLCGRQDRIGSLAGLIFEANDLPEESGRAESNG